jgi:serine/threonine protein kinase
MNEFELFQLALDIEEPTARQLFLKKACEQNEEMLNRVKALLASHDGESQFLNTPVVEQIEDPTNKAKVAKSIVGKVTSNEGEPEATALHLNGSEHMTFQDDADDEIPLGYLEPSTKPGSLGRLAHYEVLEVVGRGAFGTVLRAFDEKLHRVVAIKVMALELAATSPARKRFMREAQASAAIRHENVVSVYAVEEKPLPYLVMEYIPGRTLQQWLDERGPLDLPTVLRLGRQIAEGLAAAHAQDLIHRDVKPGNILLETSVHDRVKITDFGLARAADDASLTQSGTIAGTPMYMAPEQALGHKLDQRADLFSFGSVLYQMISGRPPFRAASALAVLKRVVDEAPRPIREIIPETPQWLCDIIAKLHAKNPDERYQSAREIADVLASCESQLNSLTGLKDFSLIPQKKRQTAARWKWVAVATLALPLLVFGLVSLNRPESQLSMDKNLTSKVTTSESGRKSSEPTELGTKNSDGWVQLFNGKDMTGWQFHPNHSGHWEVNDGILKGSNRESYLFSQRGDYANFHLRVEAKVNLGGDSGILFRAPFEMVRGRTPTEFGIPSCYEAELHENRSYLRRTGSISLATSNAPPLFLGKAIDHSLTQPDEWFTYEVIAANNHFITKINGVETANCNDPLKRLQTGHLALQVWHPNTLVQFRKIEIKELPPSSMLAEDQANRRFASDEWIDVIPLIDPEADKWDIPERTGRNAWRIDQGELVVIGDSLGSKLVLPLDSDWSAFECELEFTRRAGDSGFIVNLPTKLGECPLVIDYPGTGGGVHLGSRTKGSILKSGSLIGTGQSSTLRIEVRRQQEADHISIAVNGAMVGEWRGNRNEISNTYKEGFPHDRRVSIWIHAGGNEYVFHRIRVRTLDGGSVETLRPVASTRPEPVSEVKPMVEPTPQTQPGISNFWIDDAMKSVELPLAISAASPEIIWDGHKHPRLESDTDWIAAGELVFRAFDSHDARRRKSILPLRHQTPGNF